MPNCSQNVHKISIEGNEDKNSRSSATAHGTTNRNPTQLPCEDPFTNGRGKGASAASAPGAT
jgi:hypothetical protein